MKKMGGARGGKKGASQGQDSHRGKRRFRRTHRTRPNEGSQQTLRAIVHAGNHPKKTPVVVPKCTRLPLLPLATCVTGPRVLGVVVVLVLGWSRVAAVGLSTIRGTEGSEEETIRRRERVGAVRTDESSLSSVRAWQGQQGAAGTALQGGTDLRPVGTVLHRADVGVALELLGVVRASTASYFGCAQSGHDIAGLLVGRRLPAALAAAQLSPEPVCVGSALAWPPAATRDAHAGLCHHRRECRRRRPPTQPSPAQGCSSRSVRRNARWRNKPPRRSEGSPPRRHSAAPSRSPWSGLRTRGRGGV